MTDASILRPKALSHVVFRTANFRPMVDFWKTFLAAEPVFENEMLVFLRYDDEHHRIAIAHQPGATAPSPTAAGLHHLAFTYGSLEPLLKGQKLRQKLGIKPAWCVNHGPTTSIYYKDPDGNFIETQVDNFDTVEDATAFMTSNYFMENPIGTDFDPDELLSRLEEGEDERILKKRVEIGPRTAQDVPILD